MKAMTKGVLVLALMTGVFVLRAGAEAVKAGNASAARISAAEDLGITGQEAVVVPEPEAEVQSGEPPIERAEMEMITLDAQSEPDLQKEEADKAMEKAMEPETPESAVQGGEAYKSSIAEDSGPESLSAAKTVSSDDEDNDKSMRKKKGRAGKKGGGGAGSGVININGQSIQYRGAGGGYDSGAASRISGIFRCRLTGIQVPIPIRLIVILDKIAGGRMINLNSGYRSPRLNKMVGGVSESTHMRGLAADVTIAGLAPGTVASLARQMGAGGVGRYSSFTHVDAGPVRSWTEGGKSHKKKSAGRGKRAGRKHHR
jgi:hypothetical protein